MEKYIFKKYDSSLQRLYAREKAKLKRLLTEDTQIEHIGSTAVCGLGGKGIIDIIISVNKKDIERIKKRLNEGGYNWKPKAGEKDRFFFEKDYKYRGKMRRVHIHLTNKNSKIWKRCILIRDYLKQNEQDARKYERLKKEAVKLCKGEGKVYRECKKSFINKLEKKALKGKKL